MRNELTSSPLRSRTVTTGTVTCRFTHVYPDGPAPYYTILAPGRRGAELEQWDEIKAAVSERLIKLGGTITHHHAVGRDHRPWYDQQRPEGFARALKAAKSDLDPRGILNLGVLLDKADRPREAEVNFRQALAAQKKLATDLPDKPVYRHDLGRTYNNLGALLRKLGRHQQAEDAYRQAERLYARLAKECPKESVYRNDPDRFRLVAIGGLQCVGTRLHQNARGSQTMAWRRHVRTLLALPERNGGICPAKRRLERDDFRLACSLRL